MNVYYSNNFLERSFNKILNSYQRKKRYKLVKEKRIAQRECEKELSVINNELYRRNEFIYFIGMDEDYRAPFLRDALEQKKT